MNELSWLKLSGLMHHCYYNKENPNCPFIRYRGQDYLQHLNTLNDLSDNQAQELLFACKSCRETCKLVQSRVIAINNPFNFRVLG